MADDEMMDVLRVCDLDRRGGRGRGGGSGLDMEDSAEWVASEGDGGTPKAGNPWTSDIPSSDVLATLPRRFLMLGTKDGLGGRRSVAMRGVGKGELSVEVASSTTQLFSRVGPRLGVKSGLLRMRDALLPLTERKWEEYTRGFWERGSTQVVGRRERSANDTVWCSR